MQMKKLVLLLIFCQCGLTVIFNILMLGFAAISYKLPAFFFIMKCTFGFAGAR
jgi:hypothetical protein